MRTGGSITIRAPIEAVWAFVADARNDATWRRPYIDSVKQITPGSLGIGTRFETDFGRTPPGLGITEITEIDPPRLLAWRSVGSGGLATTDGRYVLEPIEGGTRFTVSTLAQPGGLLGLLAPLVAAFVNRRGIPRQLRQLRDLLEARPS